MHDKVKPKPLPMSDELRRQVRAERMLAARAKIDVPKKTHDMRRLDRQALIMDVIKAHACDSALTVEQICYQLRKTGAMMATSAAGIDADCRALNERGVINRQYVRNRYRKRVRAYFLV